MIGVIGSQHFSNNLIQELKSCIDIKIVTTNLKDPQLSQKAEDCEIIHYIFSPLVTLDGLRTVKALKKMKKKIIDRVIDSFPDVHFVILPSSGNSYFDRPNVTCMSWAKDMEKIYVDTRVFIRLPAHDGLPNSVFEALSTGRYVIYSHDFPHCERAYSAEEVIAKLTKLLDSSSANIEGSNYVHNKYDKNKLKRQLIELYRSL